MNKYLHLLRKDSTMIIRDKLMDQLTYIYGDIILTKTSKGTYRYRYNFDYTNNPMELTVNYLTAESKLEIKLTFLDDYKSIINNDKKANKILKYLEVFYKEADVQINDRKLVISSDYTFNPFTFDIDSFSHKVDTIEQMGRDVNDMVSTTKLY